MPTPATPKKQGDTVAYSKLMRAVGALHQTMDQGLPGPETMDRIDHLQPLYRQFDRDERTRARALPPVEIGKPIKSFAQQFLDDGEARKGVTKDGLRDPRSLSRRDVQKAYAQAVTSDPKSDDSMAALSPAFLSEETRAKLKFWQDLHDAFSFTYFAHIADDESGGYDPRIDSKRWPLYKQLFDELVMKNILTTGGVASGAEFVPTLLSGQLIPLFRQALVVAADIPHYNMTGKVEELPLQGVSPFFYFVPESSSANPATSVNQIPSMTISTGKLTLTAKKLAGTAVISTESTEDSVLAMLQFLREEVAQAGAETLDSAVVNGATSSDHLDDDVTADTDHRKIWDGMRALVHATEGKISAGAIMSSKFVSQAMSNMGKFASFPDQISTYLSAVGHVSLSRDTQYIGRDKMDAQSTLLTGQVGVCMGTKVQVSGHIRRDLAANGQYDSSSSASVQNTTIAIVAHRPSFMIGDRRVMMIDQVKDVWQDSIVLLASMRNDFIRRQAESTFNRNVVVIHNVTAEAASIT